MNERIQALAEQAGFYVADGKIYIPSTSEEITTCQKKFAELIVAECLDVVAMRIYLGPEEICRQECKALASEIKEHFGVEE
jgi:hypothetical protein